MRAFAWFLAVAARGRPDRRDACLPRVRAGVAPRSVAVSPSSGPRHHAGAGARARVAVPTSWRRDQARLGIRPTLAQILESILAVGRARHRHGERGRRFPAGDPFACFDASHVADLGHARSALAAHRRGLGYRRRPASKRRCFGAPCTPRSNANQGPCSAVLLTAPLFAVLHFFAKASIPAAQVSWGSGFDLLVRSFAPLSHPALVFDSFLAWLAVGLILSLTRVLTGNIAVAIGLHAGWVVVLRMLQESTARGSGASLFGVGRSVRRFVGVLAAAVGRRHRLWRCG